MQSVEEITSYLKRNLSEKRFDHTMGVAKTAKSLAERWGEDSSRAFLAGLVHDCAKEVPYNEAISILEKSGYIPDLIERESPGLLHAPLGAVLAKDIFGIEDEEILDAVRYHTTGRVGMTLLEKIIYVADFAEPSRRYKEAEELRTLAEQDLDLAVLKEADIVIKFTVDKGKAIHTRTILARNFFLKFTKEGKINES